jgi:hypothetical protein
MAMVPYRGNGQMIKKKKKVPFSFNPNQLVYNFGEGIVDGIGTWGMKAVNGIVSAFQQKGASKQEITKLIAPLAKSLSYGSKRPKFNKAEGGLMIEHIENLGVATNGHTFFPIDSNLFAWLSGIANQFEEYQIQMWFAWNPICPATTVGKTMLAFDHDPADTGDNRYEDPADYFNTADHCISAIWAPAAIAPSKSGWLKTGNNGDARLVSPGILHISTTDATAGFLTVKYQVSLRKPQPYTLDTATAFNSSYTTATNIFQSASGWVGNVNLIEGVTSTTVTIRATPGYKVVVWSTDASVASVSPTLTNAVLIGSHTGGGAAFSFAVKPNTQAFAGATVTAPGGSTSAKLQVYQTPYNPLYYTW